MNNKPYFREWELQKAKNRNPKQVLGDKWKTNNYYVFRE